MEDAHDTEAKPWKKTVAQVSHRGMRGALNALPLDGPES